MEASSGTATLTIAGLVAQKTAEDWDGVEFEVSTADIQRTSPPEPLKAWRIGRARPSEGSGWKELADMSHILFSGYDKSPEFYLPPPPSPASPSIPEMHRIGSDVESELYDQLNSPVPEMGSQQSSNSTGGIEPYEDADRCEPDEAYDDYDDCEEPEYEESLEEIQSSDSKMEMSRSIAPPSPVQSAPKPKKSASKKRSAPQMNQEMPMESMAADGAMIANEMSLLGRSVSGGSGFGGKGGAAGEIIAGKSALEYHQLRMKGADDSGYRGQLVSTGFYESVLEETGQSNPENLAALQYRLQDRINRDSFDPSHLSLPDHVQTPYSPGNFPVVYPAQGPAKIQSNGSLHKIHLQTASASVDRVYRCIPRNDVSVYEFALFQNPINAPLLPGPVAVYRSGEFIVDTPMTAMGTEGKIEINMGVCPEITIARNTFYNESTSGLMGGNTNLDHKIEIEIQSNLDQEITVEIFERVPNNKAEDKIKISTKTTPEAEEYNQTERGIHIVGGWKFSLALKPREKKMCTIEYDISIPSSTMLTGGNRREFT